MMSQVDFAYGLAGKKAGAGALAIAIFADRPHLREQLREDAEAAGFSVRVCAAFDGLIDQLSERHPMALGEAALVDCPLVDEAALEALSRLADAAGRGGPRLVVSTTIDALDAVFVCCAGSDAQILVSPSRAERALALGQVLASRDGMRVRELADGDRMMLLRLTEQVGRLASRLDGANGAAGEVTALAEPRDEASLGADGSGDRLLRHARPSLPDPRLIRRIIRQRQLRARYLDGALFADPAWDMLLDLTAARAEHLRVSVTSLCIASGVPPTTALRWISQMTETGLLERVEDPGDRRRAFIALTDKVADAMARYFAEIGSDASHLV